MWRTDLGENRTNAGMVMMNVLFRIYHYIFYAVVRGQIALGGDDSKYSRWKARLPMLAFEMGCWIVATGWGQILIQRNYLRGNGSNFMLASGVVAVLITDSYLFNANKRRDIYMREFRAWPKAKRRKWDRLLIIAAVLVPILGVMLIWYGGTLVNRLH